MWLKVPGSFAVIARRFSDKSQPSLISYESSAVGSIIQKKDDFYDQNAEL